MLHELEKKLINLIVVSGIQLNTVQCTHTTLIVFYEFFIMSLDELKKKNIKKFIHDNKHSKVMHEVVVEVYSYVISVSFPNQRHKFSLC